MSIGRKLELIEELPDILAIHHRVEGTSLHILELLMFGPALSSKYVLLRTARPERKLKDKSVREEISRFPYRFGKELKFGLGLELSSNGLVVFTAEIAKNRLMP